MRNQTTFAGKIAPGVGLPVGIYREWDEYNEENLPGDYTAEVSQGFTPIGGVSFDAFGPAGTPAMSLQTSASFDLLQVKFGLAYNASGAQGVGNVGAPTFGMLHY